jgi:hypothetical protein
VLFNCLQIAANQKRIERLDEILLACKVLQDIQITSTFLITGRGYWMTPMMLLFYKVTSHCLVVFLDHPQIIRRY